MKPKSFFLLFVFIILCGCWDQRLLKNERNVNIGGLDAAPKGMLRATVALRDVVASESGSKDTNEVHSVNSKTVENARTQINQEVAGNYSPTKMRVLLLGENLVRKHDILPVLNVYYRDPKSPLEARVAVVRGTAEDMINMKPPGGPLVIGQFIDQLISSGEKTTSIPIVNIQSLHPLDPGVDFALPYIINRDKFPTLRGIALFHKTSMTSTLNLDESTIYLLLADKLANKASITCRTESGHQSNSSDYISIGVQHSKRSLKVNVTKDQQLRVTLNLRLKVTVIEYSKDHLDNKEVVDNLNRYLSEKLTVRATKVIKKMQRAHHDGFGIARRIMAHYPNVWKEGNWSEMYSQAQFNTHIQVEITNYGVIY